MAIKVTPTQMIKDSVKNTGIQESRKDNDTLRLWENYRDQATMWRSLALLQIPTTLCLVVLALVLWMGRTTILSVPAKPLPGQYLAKEIPDSEFIEFATNFVNLIGSFQPKVVNRQFREAGNLLREPALTKFREQLIDIELRAIESSERSQIFFADPTKTTIARTSEREVTVTFTGERLKVVAGKEMPLVLTKYTVVMTTLPRQSLNPYGITITNFGFESISD